MGQQMISEKIKETCVYLAAIKSQLADLQAATKATIDDLNASEKKLHELIEPANRFQSDALLVRKVAAVLTQTGDLNAAVHMVAESTGLSAECVFFTFRRANRIKNILERHARIYTAQKMKKSGFTAKQIAGTLGVSEKYVYKLLTAKIEPVL